MDEINQAYRFHGAWVRTNYYSRYVFSVEKLLYSIRISKFKNSPDYFIFLCVTNFMFIVNSNDVHVI